MATKGKRTARKSGDGPNLYEMITEKIVAQLESGSVPWRRPWSVATMPRSLSTGKPYRGVNVFLLLCEGRTSPWWLTFNQAKERGGTIRKGEKHTKIFFWKRIVIREKQPDGSTEVKVIPMLKYFQVFNLDQTEGVTLTEREQALTTYTPLSEQERNAAAEEIISGYPNAPRTHHDGGGRAYYSPATDTIHLPKRDAFGSAEGYYSTRFHEMTHSTGHGSRLDRHTADDQFKFGSHAYGREELVAQMGAAFLAGEAGILSETIENDAAYLRLWIATIREDVRAVVVAAGAAQRAADHILGRAYEGEQPADDDNAEAANQAA